MTQLLARFYDYGQSNDGPSSAEQFLGLLIGGTFFWFLCCFLPWWIGRWRKRQKGVHVTGLVEGWREKWQRRMGGKAPVSNRWHVRDDIHRGYGSDFDGDY